MTALFVFVVLVVGALTSYVVGYIRGCRYGVEHTLKRCTQAINESTAQVMLMRFARGEHKGKDLPS